MHNFLTDLWQIWAAMPRQFAIFMVCWILLGIGAAIFYKTASYEVKKSAHPILTVGFGVVFLAFTEWLMRWKVPWFFILALIVITFLNIRNTKFYSRFARVVFHVRCSVRNTGLNCNEELRLK
ncbi:MAG: hypothetical protein WA655_24875 [Candidatus Korobacteraceae bacterium]